MDLCAHVCVCGVVWVTESKNGKKKPNPDRASTVPALAQGAMCCKQHWHNRAGQGQPRLSLEVTGGHQPLFTWRLPGPANCCAVKSEEGKGKPTGLNSVQNKALELVFPSIFQTVLVEVTF